MTDEKRKHSVGEQLLGLGMITALVATTYWWIAGGQSSVLDDPATARNLCGYAQGIAGTITAARRQGVQSDRAIITLIESRILAVVPNDPDAQRFLTRLIPQIMIESASTDAIDLGLYANRLCRDKLNS